MKKYLRYYWDWHKIKIIGIAVFVIFAYFFLTGLQSGQIQSFFNTSSSESQYIVSDSSEQNIVKDASDKIFGKPNIDIASLEAKIHNLINAERVRYGISQLTLDSKLSDIARAHSYEMSQSSLFSHVNLGGQDPTTRAAAAGYSCYKSYGSYYTDGIGENIFQNNLYDTVTYYNGFPSYDWNTEDEIASSTVNGWIDSPGHRENILTITYDKEGIGVAISSDNKVYITQDFC